MRQKREEGLGRGFVGGGDGGAIASRLLDRANWIN